MSEPSATDLDLISFGDAGELLGIDLTKVHQLIKDGQLVVTTDDEGTRRIPRVFVAGGVVVKSLGSVISLLRDARFTDAEIIDWLFSADDSLPGTPAKALADNRGTEVKRRAQAAG